MAKTIFKFKITQDVVDQTKSKQLNFSFQGNNKKGKPINAYRVDSIRTQIVIDAIADGDSWSMQLSYLDLNTLALETINQDDEIFTFGEDFKLLGTNGPITKNTREIAVHGVRTEVNKFIVKEEAFLNFDTVGQAGGVKVANCEMEGNYVHLEQDDIDRLLKPTTVK